MQKSPLVYRRCKTANTGKKKARLHPWGGPFGKEKKSGPQLTSLSTPCHFLLKLQFSSYGRERPAAVTGVPPPPLAVNVAKCFGRLHVCNLWPENLPESETKPAGWPFSFSPAPPKSCCILAPTWLPQPQLTPSRPRLG